MKADRHQTDDENYRRFNEEMDEGKKVNAAERSYCTAVQLAKRFVKSDGLLPSRNDNGEQEYDLQQGLRASCHAREDIAATLILQRDLLYRLDRNYKLLIAGILLLIYIAYRVA